MQAPQKGMVAVAEWPSPLAAPPPDTPKQRKEGAGREGVRKGPARPLMTKFMAAAVYLQVCNCACLNPYRLDTLLHYFCKPHNWLPRMTNSGVFKKRSCGRRCGRTHNGSTCWAWQLAKVQVAYYSYVCV